MAKYDNVIKKIISKYEKSLSKHMPGVGNWDVWTVDKAAISDMFEEVKHLRSITKPVPKTLGDISDLPEELRAELSAIKTDDVEDQIFTIINASDDREANIDTILVELYRRFGTVHKRNYITNKLWRMVNKSEMLWNGESGKGYYTTKEPNNSGDTATQRNSDDLDLDEQIPF
ncbi:hypothetical protein DES40_1138 [Litorimonas taeanensis]|uniref:Uncharacterized protein n=1 Tax=Litorimonas taeanensis TaxID=568099 RepID=A0A420WLA5_9PROT|nr:hypothetical protein [Litorimonas taeanensis]RKQ71808.1 hypothetical protein DES40_1138 [Litorimonas taeanensis]